MIQIQIKAVLLAATLAGVLAGCGGAETQKLPDKNLQQSVNLASYDGPTPQTADVQSFKINVWDNLAANNRCGSCHGVDGPGTPAFTRNDDINLAYALINGLIDTQAPAKSRLVTKVANGHNCWLSQNSACAAILTVFLDNWISSSINDLTGKQIQLKDPVIKNPGSSKNFPSFSNLISPQLLALGNLHNVLTTRCVQCHVASANQPEQPYFASADLQTAYLAMQSKINLDSAGNSRLVIRLRDEFHNCWSDCATNAGTMQSLIQSLADTISPVFIDPALIASKALRLKDGIVASGGTRVENNVIALYEFKTGTGTTAFDTSGISPELHLTLNGNINWLGGWGIDIKSGHAQGDTASSKKLHDMILSTGEYSIEAWVVPANVTQEGPASIISYTGGDATRNFTLGQTLYNYDFLQRSSGTMARGEPALSTADADEDLQASLQHVVATFDPVNGRRIYVNGAFTGDNDTVAGAGLSGWDDTFSLFLGSEPDPQQTRQWQGQIRMLAIHNRALNASQIKQNFDVGVGEKFFLLFSIADLVNMPQSYIVFEVSQFDEFSYLFNQPRFINLDPNFQLSEFSVKGLHLAMNGKVLDTGQAYVNMSTTVTVADYDAAKGQLLSSVGTIIPIDKGVDLDEFFLVFDRIGTKNNPLAEPPVPPAVPPVDLPASSDIGLRLFDDINATLSAITGVSTVQADVKGVYDTVKQQLPAVENINGFLVSQQMAISQLVIEYCNALLDDKGQIASASYFPGFVFASADTAFNSTVKRDLIFNPMIEHIYPENNNTGTALFPATQPSPAAVKTELNNLVNRLTSCATGIAPTCATAARTRKVVKASCAAVLGSAVMLIQ